MNRVKIGLVKTTNKTCTKLLDIDNLQTFDVSNISLVASKHWHTAYAKA